MRTFNSTLITFVDCRQIALVSPTGEQYECLQKQLRERIEEGCGETIYVVGMGTGEMRNNDFKFK